jgi:oligopeptide/dipeptide ABC transporter ATP-binding protein
VTASLTTSAVSIDRRDPLRVEDLGIAFGGGRTPVVRGVSFEIPSGQAFGLVGESGSGKTLTCRAVLGLLPPGAEVSGRIRLGEVSLLELPRREMQELRGSRVSMIFQDPMTALNPVLRVGDALSQVIQSHQRIARREARRRAIEMMGRVGIRDAGRRWRSYPHEFSGGMRQRILIAMALASRPSLLLADEPTTALDVIVQAGILRLIDRLRREESMSLLLVSHDISIVAGTCDRVGVMYAGELVEEGPTSQVLFRPRHPYTRALVESLPESATAGPLPSIPGSPPEPGRIPQGCAFAPRCPLASEECRVAPIPLVNVGTAHSSRCIHVDRLDAMRLTPADDALVEEPDVA